MNETRYQMDLLKAMNQNLSARERMYRMICDMTDGAFLYLDACKNEIITVGKWAEFFDFEIREKRDLEKLYERIDEPYVIPLREVLLLDKSGKEDAKLDVKLKGSETWIRVQARAAYDKDGKLTDKVIGVINVTEKTKQTQALDYYSYYDVITGLYNRNYFIRLLGELITKAKKEGTKVSVMMIDIDDFHKINDGMGMIYGDDMIKQLGSVLEGLCNEKVFACHLNSDIYAMAIYDPKGKDTPAGVHEAITKRLSAPFYFSGDKSVRITVTIGVAEYPEAADHALDLMNCAEIVTLKGKSLGKDSFVYFDQPILKEFMLGLELESKLKDAVIHNQFELYYQPQFYCGNKKLRGFEALLRLKNTERQISPSVFIPVAEKNGEIIPIGNWVVEEAIKQYGYWKSVFDCHFILSINVSARQFNQEDFVTRLFDALERYHVAPYDIELEMTESILIEDFSSVSDKMKLLGNKGVRISLDDFGTGFSSLSYLKKLPINTLKIDKSFIDTLLLDSTTRIITDSIVGMVRSLGFESIAEGVEEEQQYKYLHAIGCDVIQGYLFGKPLNAEGVEKLLRQ